MNNIEERVLEARREYYRQYREVNRGRINEKAKEWRERNKDKVKANNLRYWENKADQLQQ